MIKDMKCFNPQKFNDNIVSCGRCAACKTNRINGWVVRLEKHQRYNDTAHFITLTYADGNAVQTKNGLLTLHYPHVQQFIQTLKNLQNANSKKSFPHTYGKTYIRRDGTIKSDKRISYYCAGEYGGQFQRPHYHLILFNADIELVPTAWSTIDKSGRNSRGHIHTGNITGSSIRYCLKYISKPSRIPLFKGDDRTPEFSYMSKGVGADYISEATVKWHKADLLNRYYIPGMQGKKITMPRYYADKIYTKNEKLQIAETLEKKSSEAFFSQVLLNQEIVNSLVQAKKAYTKKFFSTKQSQLL